MLCIMWHDFFKIMLCMYLETFTFCLSGLYFSSSPCLGTWIIITQKHYFTPDLGQLNLKLLSGIHPPNFLLPWSQNCKDVITAASFNFLVPPQVKRSIPAADKGFLIWFNKSHPSKASQLAFSHVKPLLIFIIKIILLTSWNTSLPSHVLSFVIFQSSA